MVSECTDEEEYRHTGNKTIITSVIWFDGVGNKRVRMIRDKSVVSLEANQGY